MEKLEVEGEPAASAGHFVSTALNVVAFASDSRSNRGPHQARHEGTPAPAPGPASGANSNTSVPLPLPVPDAASAVRGLPLAFPQGPPPAAPVSFSPPIVILPPAPVSQVVFAQGSGGSGIPAQPLLLQQSETRILPHPRPIVPLPLALSPATVAKKGKPRPPHCDICGREFKADRFLKLHVEEIHSGKRSRFTCGDCGQVYTRLRSLERHQNKHHLNDTPVCKICRKKVVNFELHYRKFHCKSKAVQATPKGRRLKSSDSDNHAVEGDSQGEEVSGTQRPRERAASLPAEDRPLQGES